jgi:WD40 repeat protein
MPRTFWKTGRRWGIGVGLLLAGLGGWAALDLSGRSQDWPVVRTLPGPISPLWFDRIGRTLTAWRSPDEFFEFDLTTGDERVVPRREILTPDRVSPDGRYALRYGFDQELRIIGVATGTEIRRQTVAEDYSASVFAADGRSVLIFSGVANVVREVQAWDLATGTVASRPLSRPPTILPGTERVPLWVPSPDGRLLAYRDRAASGLQLWDVASDRPAGGVLRTPTSRVYLGSAENLVFTPDGRFLLHAQFDGRVEVWDVARRVLDRTLVVGTPDDFIDSLTISQDGRLLLTNSYPDIQNPIRRGLQSARDAILPAGSRSVYSSTTLIDLATGRILARAPGGGLRAISPDGRTVALYHRDRLTIHRVPPLGPPAGPSLGPPDPRPR